jgi:hypothetical protein
MNSYMNKDSIQLKLIAEPRQFSIAERHNFMIGIAATNKGSKILDPELFAARLIINGKESLTWSEAIANGHREADWFALPPGETVSMNWPSMGESFFPVPGEYTLMLRLGNKETSPIAVSMLP